MEIIAQTAPVNGPRINYRFLLWSAKDGVDSRERLIGSFLSDAKNQGTVVRLFRFVDDGDKYILDSLHDADLTGSLPPPAAVLTIIATISSLALDHLLSHYDMESAGHLRDTGPNSVFDRAVVWPIELSPGTNDILVVIRPNSETLTLLMQRRLITSHAMPVNGISKL